MALFISAVWQRHLTVTGFQTQLLAAEDGGGACKEHQAMQLMQNLLQNQALSGPLAYVTVHRPQNQTEIKPQILIHQSLYSCVKSFCFFFFALAL